MADKTANASSKKKQFRWTSVMIEDLLNALENYKAIMEFKGKDFDGDRNAQYTALRKEMSKKYDFFGPEDLLLTNYDNDIDVTESRKIMKMNENAIKQGYQRILEKIKDIRQRFGHAATVGSRSGSGKIIFEHFDRLSKIYGGSAAANQIETGIDSSMVNDGGIEQNSSEYENDDDGHDDHPSLTNPEEKIQDSVSVGTPETQVEDVNGKKRKNSGIIPSLIDNKRKHLEKNLNASQRDAILLNQAKEDITLRREMIDTIKATNDSFNNSINNISKSMEKFSETMAQSMMMLANSLKQPQPHMYAPQQNFYQQQPPSQPFINDHPWTNDKTFTNLY